MKKYNSGDIIKHRSGKIGIYLGYIPIGNNTFYIDRILPPRGDLITVIYKNPELRFHKFCNELWEKKDCITVGNTHDLIPEIGDYVFFIPKRKILKIDKFFFNTESASTSNGKQEISYMTLKEFYWDPNIPATMNDCVLLKIKDELVTVVDKIYI